MLQDVLEDEARHVEYTNQAIVSVSGESLDALYRKMRWKLRKEAWLRFAHTIGLKVAGLWLGLIYLIVVTPFRVFARLSTGGWRAPSPDSRALLDQARSPA